MIFRKIEFLQRIVSNERKEFLQNNMHGVSKYFEQNKRGDCSHQDEQCFL